MNWKIKAGIVGGVIILIMALLFIIKSQHDMIQQQRAIQQSMVQMKQLQDGIVRSQSEYISRKDLDSFAKQSGVDLGPIQSDVKTLGAQIQGISLAIVKTPGENKTNINSTKVIPRQDPQPKAIQEKCPDGSTVTCPNSDPFGYMQNTQELALTEPFNDKVAVPFGKVEFSAWRNKPWDLTVEPRSYSTATVLSVSDQGRHFVHNQIIITVGDKKYKIPVEHSEFAEVYPSESFSFWNPRLTLGAGLNITSLQGAVVPSINFAMMSYGQTKYNPTFRFVEIGIGYDLILRKPQLVISPVMYRLFDTDLVRNMYIGPAMSLSMDKNISVLFNISTSL